MTRLGYLKAFAKSWQHGSLAIVALGVPFASGVPLALVAGATAYVLGWVLVGDSKWFRRKVDAAELARLTSGEDAEFARVRAERDKLLVRLPSPQRERYQALAGVCHDVEGQLVHAGAESFAVERLDGLMWSYLGLLGNESNLGVFIEREIDEKFGHRISELEPEITGLEAELAAVQPGTPAYESRMQLLASKQEGLEALRKRHQQLLRAAENLELVRAEQERIEHQLKLLRSDLYASTSVGQISQRVNDTIDQLASSGRLSAEVPPAIQELPTFKTRRVGYDLQKES